MRYARWMGLCVVLAAIGAAKPKTPPHAPAPAAGSSADISALMGHPERWPATAKINREMKLGPDVLKAGTVVVIHDVTRKGVTVRAPQGFLFDVDANECDIAEGASALAATLTPEQRALTLAAIAKDPSLMPAKVATAGVLEFAHKNYPAGTELVLLNVSATSVGLWTPNDKSELLSPADTDLFARARERLLMPKEKRSGRIGEILKGLTVDETGKPSEVGDAKYYVMYVAASTCPRCKVFTPKFVDYFHKKLGDRKDVALFTEPTDVATPPMLAYMKLNTIPWPTLPLEKHNAMYAFAEANGMAIPGIFVVDRFGTVLLSTRRLPGTELEAADAAMAKLDDVLKPDQMQTQ